MEIGAAIFFTNYSMSPTDLAAALEERGFDWSCQVNLSRSENLKAACAITLRSPHSAIRSSPRLERSQR